MGRHRARGHAPHRAVSLRSGRRGRPLDRRPARRRSHPSGRHAGPPGRRQSPACPGNGTRSAPPAWPPSSGTGCAPPHPPTGPRPAARPARRTRKPPAAAWRRPPGSRCGGRSPPLQRQRTSEQEFFARLGQAGILVRKRLSVTSPGQITGYSVAFPGDITKDGGPVWYGGGKLAPDLSWPKLRQRWAPGRATPGRVRPDLTAGERERALGPRHPDRRRRHRADPCTSVDRPGRRRRRLGGLGHLARGRRHAGQPRPAASRRRLRPCRPLTLRAHPATHPGRKPAAARCPDHVRVRLPDRRPVHDPARAHRQAGRTRRSCRRTPRIPAARRPGRRRTTRRRTSLCRRLPGTSTAARRLRTPALLPSSPGYPSPHQPGQSRTIRIRAARPRSGQLAITTQAITTTATWP